ncbi:tRNA adenosine(34) deaminase TadA [Aliifodinibius sp. S!AR15-10]|uniref:tRNA adenosine(34) deaminase TadA n=1 Tax=Aliifodinibius sp. S!AR15-10 TaxID=2950437 RepID=UPI002862ACA1|nr:tRNA adenosine(34) deaminase TadA [Aliifodinibius sp. S!AR15-10]MDR8390932.1 tRNA adenosine(34) deaminase TadA [Aliifodinibius sp. S!AR15-10]
MSTNGKSPIIRKYQQYMIKAFKLAEQAYDEDEVPVGAIVVKDDSIIGKGYNQTERLKDPTAHAEMLAISAACSTIENKYLTGCTLYVTLEPCPMCAGALVSSKIDRIVFGAPDVEGGACGSLFNIASSNKLNHQVEVIQGVMEEDCKWILKQFFQEQRSKSNGEN